MQYLFRTDLQINLRENFFQTVRYHVQVFPSDALTKSITEMWIL
jgi:hypothetical protein